MCRKRKSSRKQFERRRKQNEIRTRISVCRDGSRVRVTLGQQSGTRARGTRLKMADEVDVLSLWRTPSWLELKRGGMERVFFILRFRLHLCSPGSHV